MGGNKLSCLFQKIENAPYREFYLIIFLLSFSLFLYTFKLGSNPFFNPDEGLHAEVAKRMVVDGDWITPRFNGSNFYDKPILYYWLNALCFKFFGINEFAARLPAAILGALGVILTYLSGKTLYDTWTGFMAAVILSISIEYLFLSRLVVHDISLAVGITSSLLLFYYGFLHKKIHRWVIPFFYISLAWSVLAKGPLGLVLPGIIIGLYVLLKKDWKLIKELQIRLGIIIFLPLVATWYVPVSLQNKDFLSYFIFHQHLRQFLSTEARHNVPVYYYLPVFLGGFFPWSIFAPYACFTVSSPLKKLLERKADLFILLWFTLPFIFFSVARSKNSTYILPIYPAASIMVAKLWMELILNFSAKSKGIRFSLFGLLSFLMAAFIFIIMYYSSYWYIGIILFAGTALSLLFLFLKKSILSFCVLSANSVIVLVVVIVYLIPSCIPLCSTKNLSLYLKQVISPSDKLAEYKRITNSTVFYSDRLIPVIKGRDNLLECLESKGGWYLLIDKKDYLKNQIEITKRSKVIYQEGKHMLLTNKEAEK